VPPETQQPKSRLVLVAENDDDARSLVVSAVRELGFAVVEARDGQELLEHADQLRATQQPIALVLSDIGMPRCDGIEAARSLLSDAPQLRVVLMTAFGDAATLKRAKLVGAKHVLRKPFSLSSLQDVIVAFAAV
jgi:two-component system response regulator (stage 0 sporulation protein F)